MKSRLIVMIATCSAIGLASYSGSIPALFIAVIGAALYWQGHAIEVKLNKLLDDRGLTPSPEDWDA